MGADKQSAGDKAEHLRPLLDALAADPQKREYYRGLLRPLERYDREHHGDLVKTLKAYIRCGGNSTQAAAALFMHRNSIRYRLQHIRSLTNLDPDDAEERLALQIGVLVAEQASDR